MSIINKFQHTEHPKLISKVLVEELLEQNPDLFAIAIVIHTERDDYWCVNSNETFDEKRIVETISETIGDLKRTPDHCGDCIKLPCTCIRCLTEGMHTEAEEIITRWNVELKNNSIIELLCVLLSTEHHFLKKNEYIRSCSINKTRLDREKIKEYYAEMTLSNRYKMWHKLSSEEKHTIQQRAIKFRAYFDHPITSSITE